MSDVSPDGIHLLSLPVYRGLDWALVPPLDLVRSMKPRRMEGLAKTALVAGAVVLILSILNGWFGWW